MTRIPLHHKIRIALIMARPGSGPRFASLFITRSCDCICPYCKSIRQPFTDISHEQWYAVIDRLHAWGVRLFSITGGEPLMRSDLADIVAYITQKKKSVCWIISNFKSMEKPAIDTLQAAGLQFLTSSLDALDGSSVKSEGERVLNLLDYAKTRGIIPSALTVVTQDNLHSVPDTAQEVTRRGIIFDMGLYQHVGGAFSPSDTALKPLLMTDVEQLRKMLRKLKIKTGLVAPSWSYLSEPVHRYDTSSWKCTSERDTFLVINNDGTLMTCQEYPENIPVCSIDNLNDSRWRTAKQKTVASCKGCFYGCYYQKQRIRLIDLLFDVYTTLRV